MSGQLLWSAIGFVLTSTTSRNVGRRASGKMVRLMEDPEVDPVVVFESGVPQGLTKAWKNYVVILFVTPSVVFLLTYSVHVPYSDESALSILQSTNVDTHGSLSEHRGRRHPIAFIGVNFIGIFFVPGKKNCLLLGSRFFTPTAEKGAQKNIWAFAQTRQSDLKGSAYVLRSLDILVENSTCSDMLLLLQDMNKQWRPWVG